MNAKMSREITETTIDKVWGDKIVWTRKIEITECPHTAGGYVQDERVYKNTVMVQNGAYPACSEYARERRERIGWLDWRPE